LRVPATTFTERVDFPFLVGLKAKLDHFRNLADNLDLEPAFSRSDRNVLD
jgi:hypothetical protein